MTILLNGNRDSDGLSNLSRSHSLRMAELGFEPRSPSLCYYLEGTCKMSKRGFSVTYHLETSPLTYYSPATKTALSGLTAGPSMHPLVPQRTIMPKTLPTPLLTCALEAGLWTPSQEVLGTASFFPGLLQTQEEARVLGREARAPRAVECPGVP